MGPRDVLRYPDPALRAPAAPVEDPASVAALAEELLATMDAAGHSVGVSAPQIGVPLRVCVVDCTGHPKAETHHGRLVLVNPVLELGEETAIGREGCMSIPELTANVRRSVWATVSAVDVSGRPVRVVADGFEARVLQHEVDHLDGLLFLDRVANPAADVFRRRRR